MNTSSMELYDGDPRYAQQSLLEDNPQASQDNLAGNLLRRWKVILLVFLLVASVGAPVVWLFVPKQYQATAAIHVKPVISSFVFSDSESDRPMPAYDSFRTTQAQQMMGPTIIAEAANLLARKDLSIFAPPPEGFVNRLKAVWAQKDISLLTKQNADIETALRKLIRDGKITITPERKSELILVSMEYSNGNDAVQIVNALVEAYESKVVSQQKENATLLAELETERDKLYREKKKFQDAIQQIAVVYGTRDLQGHLEILTERKSDIGKLIADLEKQKIALEEQIRSIEQDASFVMTDEMQVKEEEVLRNRKQYVNSDPRVQSLTGRIIQAEEQLLIAQQELSPENPEIARLESLLASLNQKLQTRQAQLEKEFDDARLSDLAADSEGAQVDPVEQLKNERLKMAKTELENITATIEDYRAELDAINRQFTSIGNDQLEMLKNQDELAVINNLYDAVNSRLQQLRIESDKRPNRIEVLYKADSVELSNKKIKLLAGVIFAALGAGVGLAFLLTKLDKSLHTPMDVARRIGVPVIGTTVSVDRVSRKLLPEYLNSDYQNIRANLKILSEGQNLKRLAVASAGPREGKTTLAINLAASLAQTGQKVLLIDGDFRKQGVKHTLRLPVELRGFYEVVMGDCAIEDAVYFYPNAGFSVMVGSCREGFDPIDLLSRPQTGEIIELIARQYDYVIIDTPPVLIAPDAVLWGKLADAVVLSSFAGTTAAPALKETLEKFATARVKVLGNVLGNVDTRSVYGYYGYGYGYGPGDEKRRTRAATDSASLLIQHDSGETA